MAANSNGPIDSGRVIAPPTNPMVTPLLTDLYQFTMAYAYWKAGKHNEQAVSVFSLSLCFTTPFVSRENSKLSRQPNRALHLFPLQV